MLLHIYFYIKTRIKTMNTLLFLSMLAAPFCSNDTVVRVVRPDSVVISETDQQTQIDIYGRQGDPDYRFSYGRTDHPSVLASIEEHSGGWDFNLPLSKKSKKQGKSAFKPSSVDVNLIDFIHVGACVPMGAKGDVPVNAGWNLGCDLFNIQYNLPSGSDAFYVGLGIDWNFLRASDDAIWTKATDGVAASELPEGARDSRSRLTTTNLALPLRYSHAFTRKLCLDFSVQPQVAVGNRIHTKYKQDSHKVKDKAHGVGGQRFNVGVAVGLRSTKAFGIYLKYTPMNTWDDASPLNYKMLTVGVTI